MDAIIISLPVFKVANSVITGVNQSIDYSIILDKGIEVGNYNYVIRNPDKQVIQLEHRQKFFSKDYFNGIEKVNDFNLLFTDEKIRQEFNSIKFKGKSIQTSIIKSHPLIDELLAKTPFFYHRDSIIESSRLIELVKQVREYKEAIPIDWAGKLYNCFESIERLKPLSNFKNSPVFISMNDNHLSVSADDNDLVFVKKNAWIKNYPKSLKASFSSYGEPPLYSLGNTGEVSELMKSVWLK